jgi:HAD superfamily hydrolase (TIGR01490 family)
MKDWKAARAAFFDVDGTLIRLPCLETRFASGLWRKGKLGTVCLARFGLRRLLGFILRLESRRRDKSYLRGLSCAEMERRAEDFVQGIDPSVLIGEAVERLRQHREADAQCFLLTGTLDCLARPLGRRLGVPNVLATQFEMLDGCCGGYVVGVHPYGQGKLEIMEQVCREKGLSTADCAAYADRFSDLPLLEAAGYPIAVGPDRKLLAVARERGWEVLAARK